MDPVTSVLILQVVVVFAFLPWALAWANRKDSEAYDEIMTGREAAARALYGQAVGWEPNAMHDYDESHIVQEFWLREASRRIQA